MAGVVVHVHSHQIAAYRAPVALFASTLCHCGFVELYAHHLFGLTASASASATTAAAALRVAWPVAFGPVALRTIALVVVALIAGTLVRALLVATSLIATALIAAVGAGAALISAIGTAIAVVDTRARIADLWLIVLVATILATTVSIPVAVVAALRRRPLRLGCL
jgi:hypothetical protein